jgi:hypothetical protein
MSLHVIRVDWTPDRSQCHGMICGVKKAELDRWFTQRLG